MTFSIMSPAPIFVSLLTRAMNKLFESSCTTNCLRNYIDMGYSDEITRFVFRGLVIGNDFYR